MCEQHKEEDEVTSIFQKLGIDGDISPLETKEDFWKRKMVEVYEKMSVILVDVGSNPDNWIRRK